MAVLLAPQDSTNMSQAQWQEMMGGIIKDGVMAGVLNTYTTTTTSGLGISVASGRAMIQGFLARSDAAVALTAAAADPTNPRIDRAVLHADLTAHTLTVQLLTGTPAPSPSPPALTQTATVWEISLYQVRVNAASATISSLTDERAFSVPNNAVNRSGDTMAGLLVLTKLSSDSGAITSDGSGNLTAASFITSASLVQSSASAHFFIQSKQSGGVALGLVFGTWNGSAGVVPFAVGGAIGGALSYADNAGNLVSGADVRTGNSVFASLGTGHIVVRTIQSGGVSVGTYFQNWNGAAGVVPFAVGGQFGGALAWADNSGNYNGPIAGGIPVTRNGVATSVPIYTGYTGGANPSSPPTGSIRIDA